MSRPQPSASRSRHWKRIFRFRCSGAAARRVEMTDEGLELLPSVREGLEKLESALQQIKHHRRAGPLQISHAVIVPADLAAAANPLVSAQISRMSNCVFTHRASWWISRAPPTHVAIRFGRGNYPNMHSEKCIEDWLVPVASPDLIKQYGMIERGAEIEQISRCSRAATNRGACGAGRREAAWHSRAPSIEDSAGLLAAAEEGLGYALARWTLVDRALQKGTLKLAGKRRAALCVGLLFRVPKEFSGAAQGGAVPRVDFRRRARVSGTPGRDAGAATARDF